MPKSKKQKWPIYGVEPKDIPQAKRTTKVAGTPKYKHLHRSNGQTVSFKKRDRLFLPEGASTHCHNCSKELFNGDTVHTMVASYATRGGSKYQGKKRLVCDECKKI